MMGPLPATARTVGVRVVFALIGLFHWVMMSVGIWWLVYFRRQNVRALFTNAQGLAAVEGRRPFLISAFAVLLLIGSPMCVVGALLPLPALFLGLILPGWEKAILYLLVAALNVVAAIGLLRMQEWGRRVALLSALSTALFMHYAYALRPSLMVRDTEAINKSLNVQTMPLPGQFQHTIAAIQMLLSILILLAILAMLHHYRGRFGEGTETSHPEPETLG